MAGNDLCFWHDPERRKDLLDATRRGGQNRRRRVQLPVAEPLSAEDARAILAGLVEAVVSGAVDAATARTVGYLLQVEHRIREGHDLERRIAALEEIHKREGATSWR